MPDEEEGLFCFNFGIIKAFQKGFRNFSALLCMIFFGFPYVVKESCQEKGFRVGQVAEDIHQKNVLFPLSSVFKCLTVSSECRPTGKIW